MEILCASRAFKIAYCSSNLVTAAVQEPHKKIICRDYVKAQLLKLTVDF